MTKVYTAAKYGQMLEMREVCSKITIAGHETTAQWVDGKEANDTQTAAAVMDFEDVKRADVLMAFSDKRGRLNTGGGRHVEYGIAMALGKRIMVVGPRGEHVFHAWPGVEFYDTAEEAIAAL